MPYVNHFGGIIARLWFKSSILIDEMFRFLHHVADYIVRYNYQQFFVERLAKANRLPARTESKEPALAIRSHESYGDEFTLDWDASETMQSQQQSDTDAFKERWVLPNDMQAVSGE